MITKLIMSVFLFAFLCATTIFSLNLIDKIIFSVTDLNNDNMDDPDFRTVG